VSFYLNDAEEEKFDKSRKDDDCQREKRDAEAAIDGVSPQLRDRPGRSGVRRTSCSFRQRMNSDLRPSACQFLGEASAAPRACAVELRLGNRASETEERVVPRFEFLRPLTPTRLGDPDSVVQNDVEQRPVNADAAVVFNKAELAKAIHEEANA
jgi:hypothetical protein